MINKGHLIAIMADEDTCVGFLLGGIGEINDRREVNYFVVEKSTIDTDIEDSFKRFIKRKDIDLLLITYEVADRIKDLVRIHHNLIVPAILEIPSKVRPYDPETDPIHQAALQHGALKEEGK
ncbi:V-type proton ATPase subunit F-like [Aethina tumida]|uniref:V-type proton ATPase subunit F-like n=1 Tax=Aethina tumida TaxID=116153 RepID=UPI00214759F4|nr:V-type proton ATPase subunit F-like [Aethina tumida]